RLPSADLVVSPSGPAGTSTETAGPPPRDSRLSEHGLNASALPDHPATPPAPAAGPSPLRPAGREKDTPSLIDREHVGSSDQYGPPPEDRAASRPSCPAGAATRRAHSGPLRNSDRGAPPWTVDSALSPDRYATRTALGRNTLPHRPDASPRTRPVPADLPPGACPCGHRHGRGRAARYPRPAGVGDTHRRPAPSPRSTRPLRPISPAPAQYPDESEPLPWLGPADKQRGCSPAGPRTPSPAPTASPDRRAAASGRPPGRARRDRSAVPAPPRVRG